MRRAAASRDAAERRATVDRQAAGLAASYSAVDIRQENSYLIVAERTNTNGSRQFKRLLQEEDWDGLVSMARDEVRDGSHLLDVCVDFVGRDGVRDMHEVIRRFANQVKPGVPFMLDSTNPAVMEAGLKLAGGRCVLNSMNLEDGEEKLGHICALAKKYGAAVVAGTIDEDKLAAMATADRKISIAKARPARQSATAASPPGGRPPNGRRRRCAPDRRRTRPHGAQSPGQRLHQLQDDVLDADHGAERVVRQRRRIAPAAMNDGATNELVSACRARASSRRGCRPAPARRRASRRGKMSRRSLGVGRRRRCRACATRLARAWCERSSHCCRMARCSGMRARSL